RRVDRPSFARLARSAETSDEERDFVKASSSSASGRGFFFGGISPLLTRSCTKTHAVKFVASEGSNLSADKSSPPFFVSVSWHSNQCRSRKPRPSAGRSAAVADAARASQKQSRPNKVMRCTITEANDIQCAARGEVNPVGHSILTKELTGLLESFSARTEQA